MQIFNLWQIGKLPLGKVFDKSHSEIFGSGDIFVTRFMTSWKRASYPHHCYQYCFHIKLKIPTANSNVLYFLDFLIPILSSMKVRHFEICTIFLCMRVTANELKRLFWFAWRLVSTTRVGRRILHSPVIFFNKNPLKRTLSLATRYSANRVSLKLKQLLLFSLVGGPTSPLLFFAIIASLSLKRVYDIVPFRFSIGSLYASIHHFSRNRNRFILAKHDVFLSYEWTTQQSMWNWQLPDIWIEYLQNKMTPPIALFILSGKDR